MLIHYFDIQNDIAGNGRAADNRLNCKHNINIAARVTCQAALFPQLRVAQVGVEVGQGIDVRPCRRVTESSRRHEAVEAARRCQEARGGTREEAFGRRKVKGPHAGFHSE